ncbi:MAG TPA: hypothetical protein VHK63_06090 [Candidatus Limnocylindria bacterium]|nr:hypothetical protein [Candidatus Limnocylindria bacterium]
MGAALTVGIVALALTTGWIHLNLGGLLFTLNGLGYAGLAALYVVAAAAPHPLIASFSWAPRIMLAGYAALTIVAWAIQGPYFSTAYIAKGVEVALIALITVDVFRVHGGPMGLLREAQASIFGLGRTGSAAA